MKKLFLILALWPSLLAAQPAPTVTSTLRTTSTATTSIRVGCTLAGTCTGGITAGPIDVSTVTSAGFVEIASNIPASETNRLVNHAGTLYFNGVGLATGASLSGTLNAIPVFTGASSVGNSIMAQNVGATIITVTGALNATVTLGGTLSTATQNSVTTMTGLTSVGTIATGTWNATIIGLSKGGTGVTLAGTGGTSQFLRQNTVGGTITVVRPSISDLSDGTNVALLNATNIYTGTNQSQVPTTATQNAYFVFTNTGGSTFVGNDNSTGAAFNTGGNYAGVLYTNSTGGLGIETAGATAIRFLTNATLRWGINAAGDWTFGASSHIADSNGTPTVASGFGGAGTIVGTDYAFKVTGGAATSGTVNFGHTWTTTPVCVATGETSGASGLTVSTSTTQIGLSYTSPTGTINVLCRGY